MAALKVDTGNEIAKRQTDAFKAQTDRMDTQIKAHEADASINNKNIDSFGKKIDNTEKIMKLRQISDEKLLSMMNVG